jgi:hypothetical protein
VTNLIGTHGAHSGNAVGPQSELRSVIKLASIGVAAAAPATVSHESPSLRRCWHMYAVTPWIRAPAPHAANFVEILDCVKVTGHTQKHLLPPCCLPPSLPPSTGCPLCLGPAGMCHGYSQRSPHGQVEHPCCQPPRSSRPQAQRVAGRILHTHAVALWHLLADLLRRRLQPARRRHGNMLRRPRRPWL